MKKEIKRIPYKQWVNSQLSIARFSGGIDINGDHYEYDVDTLKEMAEDTKNGVTEEKLYKPDLVFYEK